MTEEGKRMLDIWLSLVEIRLLLDRIIECAKRYIISFATEQGGEERKKNRATARKFSLSDDDRIRIVCGLRPEEFYCVMPERVKSLDEYEDRMYVFMAKRCLKVLETDEETETNLYVKFQFKKPADGGALVVSFHEAGHEVDDSERHIRR